MLGKKPLTRQDLFALPAVIDLVTAANALGISRSVAYQLAQRGQFPTPAHKLGGSWRVPLEPLLEYLGIARQTESE